MTLNRFLQRWETKQEHHRRIEVVKEYLQISSECSEMNLSV